MITGIIVILGMTLIPIFVISYIITRALIVPNICLRGGFHKVKSIYGRSSSVTYDQLYQCLKCNKYIFHGGFEGEVNSTVMDKTDASLLLKCLKQNPESKQREKEIKQHIKNASIQFEKFKESKK